MYNNETFPPQIKKIHMLFEHNGKHSLIGQKIFFIIRETIFYYYYSRFQVSFPFGELYFW